MRSTYRVCLCILAAGASKRMHAPKLLLPFAGSSMLQHSVENALRSDADLCAVVTGAYHDQMAPVLARLGVEALRNDRWEEGQAGSVKRAVDFARSNACDALLLMVADQPYVSTQVLNALIDSFRAGSAAAYASSDGLRCGNPCLFDKSCFALLDSLSGDEGARALLRSGSLEKAVVELHEPNLFDDVDTMEDYMRVRTVFGRGR